MIIIYNDNGVKIVIPCTTELTLIQIGEKDISNNIPFWIINYEDLPSTPQETWKLENMGEPSGYGKKI
ncbi:hypothetical protein UFOVP683_12 [uncultured Caudovirales phage]|uniref:Uncharacterized protein n=1 Tax=uncultured Caudovirales phage TaxID=2100421 RepID=A0A6J5NK75_9CAUD|nr:hypothetical protein UFOVP683_12 [uncultured Caudovirales phage]